MRKKTKDTLLIIGFFALLAFGGSCYAEETKDLTLTECELLKLENADLKTKDLQTQFVNLKRNLNVALQKVNDDKLIAYKEIEERLGIEAGSYDIVGGKVVLREATND